MEELNHSLAIELAEILGAFRKDDSVPMKYQMNQEHVENWVCQFDEEYRNIILEEMIYIFKKSFYVRKDFEIFFENIIAKYEQITGNHSNPLKDMCVINMQERGSRSQQILTEIFAETYADKYNAEINQRMENQSRYIYVFCKYFLAKVADCFWRMLHLQIGEKCRWLRRPVFSRRLSIAFIGLLIQNPCSQRELNSA